MYTVTLFVYKFLPQNKIFSYHREQYRKSSKYSKHRKAKKKDIDFRKITIESE